MPDPNEINLDSQDKINEIMKLINNKIKYDGGGFIYIKNIIRYKY